MSDAAPPGRRATARTGKCGKLEAASFHRKPTYPPDEPAMPPPGDPPPSVLPASVDPRPVEPRSLGLTASPRTPPGTPSPPPDGKLSLSCTTLAAASTMIPSSAGSILCPAG